MGGHFDVAEILLGKGSDVNGTDDYGNTWLMACASTGGQEGMRWLVSKGAAVDKVSQLQYGGSTALGTAARVGQAESVRTLLELGANPHLKMKDGSTALSKGQESKNAEVVELIKAALARTPPPAAPKPKAARGLSGAPRPDRREAVAQTLMWALASSPWPSPRARPRPSAWPWASP